MKSTKFNDFFPEPIVYEATLHVMFSSKLCTIALHLHNDAKKLLVDNLFAFEISQLIDKQALTANRHMSRLKLN